jgi:hypothetical protein
MAIDKEIVFKNEEQLQAYCFQWAWNTYPQYRRLFFHVQQNMFGNAYRGSINKAIGVVKGVSDFVVISKGAVLFLEFKVGSNKQSPEQVDFENKVKSCGFKYAVVYSFIEFKTIMEDIYGKK